MTFDQFKEFVDSELRTRGIAAELAEPQFISYQSVPPHYVAVIRSTIGSRTPYAISATPDLDEQSAREEIRRKIRD